MENNRKGNGIFLGIVSISTLIVAIIGATFAYFSASTKSNEDAVNLTAYEFSLSMVVTPVFPSGANKIIPLKPDVTLTGEPTTTNTNLLYALNANPEKRGSIDKECIDDNGLQVCVLYKVEITNNNTNPITLAGQIRTVTNTPAEGSDGETREAFKNLKYRSAISPSNDPKNNHDIVLLSSEDFIDEDDTIQAKGVVNIPENPDDTAEIDSIYVPGATTDEDGELIPGKGIGFVLIYLHDTAADGDEDTADQSYEMGASYTGQLIYASKGDAGSTLTGTFNVSGA